MYCEELLRFNGGEKRKKNQKDIEQMQLEHLKDSQASDIIQRSAESCFMKGQLNCNAAAKLVNVRLAKQALEFASQIGVFSEQ